MSGFETFQSQRGREAAKATQGENLARLATVISTADSTGWGEFVVPERVDFGLAFIEMPAISHGVSLDGSKLVPTRFPHCDGGVYEWDISPKGLYRGAWVWITVETRGAQLATDVLDDPGYEIVHHFTFVGTAMKDIPAYLLKDS